MSDLAFAKQILGKLSGAPVRYSENYTAPTHVQLSLPRNILNALPEFTSLTESSGAAGSDSNEEILVKVKALKGGKEYIIKMKPGDTVMKLKERLQTVSSQPVAAQRLILKGKALTDSKSLLEFNITSSTVIHLLQKATLPAASETAAPTPVETSTGLTPAGDELLKSEPFWNSLRGFLQEQYTDAADVEKIVKKFMDSYKDVAEIRKLNH
ncbi:hypothetical protein K493DRAFT_313453 [Basidiobolus meristosporus CBS 931.73]|uniref:Ubiquitin-like domain-containing protein n=1 Tax=Basidiobolus meristosporus CBS 931.73 TaxID=1314790 RepID=A0A1Y1YLN4_9FUNG|nr:hypothetical protein K493DRAFT_313453 [Basidiobolus meristosporus CBS 931.73]|eukprot:ORX98919.1 hypothetical protein K493DRAFT_313453 [Basidiobolus meristosporus CBS 931.73]